MGGPFPGAGVESDILCPPRAAVLAWLEHVLTWRGLMPDLPSCRSVVENQYSTKFNQIPLKKRAPVGHPKVLKI